LSYQGRRPRVLQLRAAEIAVELTTVATSGAINNQAVADTSGIRFSAATSITGFVAPSAPVDNGKTLIVANVSTAELVIANESASSTAANRIITGTDSDVTLQPGMALELFYDTTTDRWRIKGGTGGGSGAGTGIRNYLQDWWDGTKSVGTVSTTGDNAGVTDRSASFKQWATSDNTKVTVVQDTGTLRGTKGYKIDSLASGSDVFVETPIFKLDAIDKGNGSSDKQIAVSFDVGGLSSDTAWYVYVRTWNGSYVLQSTKIITEGGEEQFGLAPNGSYLPICNTSNIYKRNFTIYFQPNTGLDYYSVLFRRVSGSNTDDISLSSIFVGPKLLVENMADSQAGASFGSTSIETFGKSPLEGSTLNRALYSEPNYIAAWYMGNKKIGQVVDGVGNSIGSSTRTASTLNRKKWGSSNTTQTSVSREDSNTSNTLRGENGQGAINITNPASGSDVFIESPLFYISSVDLGKPMMIQFDYSNGNTNAVHDVLVARYNSSGVLQELMPVTGGVGGSTGAPVSALLGKDGFKGQFTGFFIPTSTSNDQYALRIRRTIGAISAVNVSIASLYIGRQKTTQGNAITDSVAYTPALGNGTNASATLAQYYRVGDTLYADLKINWSAAGSGGTFSIGLPNGLQIDTTKQTSSATSNYGSGYVVKNTGERLSIVANYNSATSVFFSSTYNVSQGWSGSDFTAAGFALVVQLKVPIVGWSSNVTMADRAVEEYAFNSSTSDANDTTSFGNGAGGAQFINITAARSKRVRFQTPVQPTDKVVFEFLQNGAWKILADAEALMNPYTRQGSAALGVGFEKVSGNSTDFDVIFAAKRLSDNTTYGNDSTATSWAGIAASSSFAWRLTKISGGALVGFPIGARNVIGDATGTNVPAGNLGEAGAAGSTTNSTTSHNTYIDFSGTITLGPGNYLLAVDGSGYLNTPNTGFSTAQIEIFNSTDSSIVRQQSNLGSLASTPTAANSDEFGYSMHAAVNVPAGTTKTYKLRGKSITESGTPTTAGLGSRANGQLLYIRIG